MDEMHRSSSNRKSDENEDEDHIKGEYDVDDEQNADNDRESLTSDKPLHNDEPVVEKTSTKTHSKRDVNNDDNFKVERQRIQAERVDLKFNEQPDDTKIERKLESKPLTEYLNEHEHFLKLIDHTKKLSLYERKQLDRQKEDLKKFQQKLAKQSEENDRKRLYEKQKEADMLSKKRGYLQRRVQAANLKEMRKPLVETTFHVSNKQHRSKSQTTQTKSKANRMELSLFSGKSQPKSIAYTSDTHLASTSRHQHHPERQTDTNYFHKVNTEHPNDKLDKHLKQHPEHTGQNLEELIVVFVEHSKRSWINQ